MLQLAVFPESEAPSEMRGCPDCMGRPGLMELPEGRAQRRTPHASPRECSSLRRVFPVHKDRGACQAIPASPETKEIQEFQAGKSSTIERLPATGPSEISHGATHSFTSTFSFPFSDPVPTDKRGSQGTKGSLDHRVLQVP